MEKSAQLDLMYYIKSLAVIAVTFGFGYLPPFGDLTPVGMQAIGIFMGVLLGWIFVDMLWPSLLGIFAVGMSGFMSISDSFGCALSDKITMQLLFVLIFVAYLEISGASYFIAK